MIPPRSKKKKRVKLFVMNAKVLKKRKKPPTFSPFTREKAVKLALIVTIVGTCGFGGFEVGRYFLSDAKYAVKYIIVRGNEQLSDEEIIALSLLRKEENIFRARIYQARNRLSELPLTEHVAVTRRMPNTLLITVVERHPRAKLAGPKKLLADYSGVILPRSSCSAPDKLPLIVGVDAAHLSVGDTCSRPQMTNAMRVLELCQSSPLAALAEVDWINSSMPDDLRLYLKEGRHTKRGCEFLIGGNDFEQKLAKLEVILRSVVGNHGKKVQWANLTLERVPVRF